MPWISRLDCPAIGCSPPRSRPATIPGRSSGTHDPETTPASPRPTTGCASGQGHQMYWALKAGMPGARHRQPRLPEKAASMAPTDKHLPAYLHNSVWWMFTDSSRIIRAPTSSSREHWRHSRLGFEPTNTAASPCVPRPIATCGADGSSLRSAAQPRASATLGVDPAGAAVNP